MTIGIFIEIKSDKLSSSVFIILTKSLRKYYIVFKTKEKRYNILNKFNTLPVYNYSVINHIYLNKRLQLFTVWLHKTHTKYTSQMLDYAKIIIKKYS